MGLHCSQPPGHAVVFAHGLMGTPCVLVTLADDGGLLCGTGSHPGFWVSMFGRWRGVCLINLAGIALLPNCSRFGHAARLLFPWAGEGFSAWVVPWDVPGEDAVLWWFILLLPWFCGEGGSIHSVI